MEGQLVERRVWCTGITEVDNGYVGLVFRREKAKVFLNELMKSDRAPPRQRR